MSQNRDQARCELCSTIREVSYDEWTMLPVFLKCEKCDCKTVHRRVAFQTDGPQHRSRRKI